MATSNANWLGWSGNPAADLQRFGQAVYREMPKDQDILNAIGLGGGNRSGYLGPAYGDPAVLIGDSNLSNLPVDTRDAEIKLRQQQGGYLPPGMNAPVLNNPAADQERNRKSEADRMMQQYASDEYWDTEAGKAMLELGAQERYTGDDLAGFYDAQQAVGEGSIEEIIDAMGYTGNMAEWARANKALALREYLKNAEALPDDGYAGYGTGEPQVDERLKDVTTYSPVYAPSGVPTSSEVPATAVSQENAASNYSPLGGPFKNVNWLGTGEQAAAEEVANQFARQRVLNFLEASKKYGRN